VWVHAFTFSLNQLNFDEYLDAAKGLIVWLDKDCEDWIFNGEVTWPEDEDINPHFQGYCHLKKKARPETLGAFFRGTPFQGIHFSRASNAGKKALKDYCLKTESQFMGPWSKKPVYLGKDLWAEEKWPKWQKDLHEHLQGEPEERTVQWMLDTKGGQGKSKFVKYYGWKKLGLDLEYDTAANLRYQVIQEGPRRVYLLDLTKTKPRDMASGDLYSAIESIKNGKVVTGKYKAGRLYMDVPHVVVFSNQSPEKEYMTAGRINVINITAPDPVRPEVPENMMDLDLGDLGEIGGNMEVEEGF